MDKESWKEGIIIHAGTGSWRDEGTCLRSLPAESTSSLLPILLPLMGSPSGAVQAFVKVRLCARLCHTQASLLLSELNLQRLSWA